MLPRNESSRLSRAALALCLITSAAGCASSSARAAPDSDVRVLVYNIHAGKDAGGVENLERVATLIRDVEADLVLLQEVDRGTERSGGVDQIAELERLTGFHGAFGRTLDYQGGEYGIAVLSRWPIVSDTLIALPVEPAQERAGGSHEPRGALRVTVAMDGATIGVVNTHLDASADDHYRRQEVEAVLRIAADLEAMHDWTLIGGDFNSEPGSAVIEAMFADGWRDAFAACGSGDGRTYPAHAPVKRIDYVFVARDAGCDAARVLETTTSDHRPVLVTIPAVAIAVAAPASAPESFDVRFDHSTVLVTDLERSAAFYEDVLQLEPLATPWGPAAPIRFYSLGSGRQLHVGLTDEGIEPDKNDHLALTVSRFDDYLAFLDERGVAYGNFAASSSNPQVRPDGIRQIYLQDPDGNWIEINDAAHPLN